MSNGDNVRRGCLFGFGFAFGHVLAGVAVVAGVGIVFLVVCLFFMTLAIPRLSETRERIDHEQASQGTPAEPQPPHVETLSGTKGRLIGRDGDYVDIRLPDGTATWVRIDSLTEESQQVVTREYNGDSSGPTESPR